MPVDYTRPYGHAPASAVNRKPVTAKSLAEALAEDLAELSARIAKTTDDVHELRAERARALAAERKLDEAKALLSDERTLAAYMGKRASEVAKAAPAAPVSRYEELARDPGLAKREWDAAVAKRGR